MRGVASSRRSGGCPGRRTRGVALHQARSRREVEELVLRCGRTRSSISSYNRLLAPAVLEACPIFNVHFGAAAAVPGQCAGELGAAERRARDGDHRAPCHPPADDGPILYQEKIPIGPEDNATTLFERLNTIQRRELGPAVQRGLEGGRAWPQDDLQATYGCPRNPEDGEIDWRRPAAEIHRLARALTPPFPGAFTHHQGTTLVVHRVGACASARRYVGSIPGRVIDVSTTEGWIDVLTGGGVLRVHEMSRTGRGAASSGGVRDLTPSPSRAERQRSASTHRGSREAPRSARDPPHQIRGECRNR